MDKEIWVSHHELIASLEMRVTIEAKMITGNCRSPHNYNDTQMVEVTGQPPYTLAMVRESVESEYIHQLMDTRDREDSSRTMWKSKTYGYT